MSCLAGAGAFCVRQKRATGSRPSWHRPSLWSDRLKSDFTKASKDSMRSRRNPQRRALQGGNCGFASSCPAPRKCWQAAARSSLWPPDRVRAGCVGKGCVLIARAAFKPAVPGNGCRLMRAVCFADGLFRWHTSGKLVQNNGQGTTAFRPLRSGFRSEATETQDADDPGQTISTTDTPAGSKADHFGPFSITVRNPSSVAL
jgi:hypothetical protein